MSYCFKINKCMTCIHHAFLNIEMLQMLHIFLLLTFTGQFGIRPDKKSEPKVRKFRHVGMIAGGTGNDGHILNGRQCTHSRFPGIAAKIFNLNMY